MARLDKTATDYIAIALSPVLIMLMVGSLMYFLVAVFYRGCFEGRIYWILSCYTLAIVLIARISIEEGQERATVFGAALAMAAGFAVMRMSDVVLLPWLLLALVWWAADKLTWDCTLIDEDEDSSGRGLLQIVGLNRWKETVGRGLSRLSRRGGRGAAESPSRRENGTVPLATRDSGGDGSSVETAAKAETDDAEPEGVTARAGQLPAEVHPKRSPKRRPHAPGVWIVYFSLAALPLFGLGQLFLPAGDIERRRWAFQLLCVYVASGLGLLLTTSFLGLRRYLRRRGVEMQDDMARVWIALGAAIIVVLLFVAALLPRPAPEIALSQFPIRFTTPQRDSSRYAFGSDGADANAPDSQSFAEGDVEDERAGKSGEQDASEQGKSEQGKSEQGKSEQRQSRTSDSDQRNQMEGEPADKAKSSDDQKGKSGQAPSNGSQSDQGESGQTGQNEQGKQQAQGQPEERGEGPERGEGEASKAAEDDEPADRQQQGQPSSDNVRPREQEEEPREQEKKQSRATGSTRRSPPESPPRQPSGSGFRLPRLDLALGGLLKLLLYAVILGLVGYWLWKSRAQVLAAFQQFLRELAEFWARLFGGGRRHEEAVADEKPPEPPRLRPFSDYADPFASGAATRHAPDAIVRYTFEALEAWAREQGCPRHPDQTPREFARRLGDHDAALSAGAATLADLYCRVAYASARLSPKSIKPLEPFWQTLWVGRAERVPP